MNSFQLETVDMSQNLQMLQNRIFKRFYVLRNGALKSLAAIEVSFETLMMSLVAKEQSCGRARM